MANKTPVCAAAAHLPQNGVPSRGSVDADQAASARIQSDHRLPPQHNAMRVAADGPVPGDDAAARQVNQCQVTLQRQPKMLVHLYAGQNRAPIHTDVPQAADVTVGWQV